MTLSYFPENHGRPEHSAARLAADVALPAAAGHFDELRGHALGPQGPREISPSWETFFNQAGTHDLEDFQRRKASLDWQMRDNGVSYNVYADSSNPQRPWSLDLFPLIVQADEWRQIEAGVLQQVRLLERTLHDVIASGTREGRTWRADLQALLQARLIHYANLYTSAIADTPTQRYLALQVAHPHQLERIPLNILAAYLGITPTQLSRIRARKKGCGLNPG